MNVGDRVRVRAKGRPTPLQGAVGTITVYTCATARYVRLDMSGQEFNFRTVDLELITERAPAGYEELFT